MVKKQEKTKQERLDLWQKAEIVCYQCGRQHLADIGSIHKDPYQYNVIGIGTCDICGIGNYVSNTKWWVKE